MNILLFILPFIGGAISRFHGGGFKGGVNKSFKNFLWSSFFALGTYYTANSVGESALVTWVLTILCLALCLLKATGHGTYFLARPLKGLKEQIERFDFIVTALFGEDWRTNYPEGHKFTAQEKKYFQEAIYDDLYFRNVFGMALTGFLAVSGAVLAFSYINPLAGLIVALGGCMKGLCYAFGEWLLPNGKKTGVLHFMYSTEIAEALTGLFAYLGLALAIVVAA